MNQEVLSKINNLEQKILVWSIIYYRFGDSIITDKQYDTTAKELQRLIKEYPQEFGQSILYEDFNGFSFVSGYDLPLYDPKYTDVAEFVLSVTRLGMEGYKDKKGREPLKLKKRRKK